MKWDKSTYVVGAIYRMFLSGKITKECAVFLLRQRANIKRNAEQTVQIWLTNYDFRQKAGAS